MQLNTKAFSGSPSSLRDTATARGAVLSLA